MPVIRGQITLGKVKNGEDGVPGPPGSTTYTWVKYADTPTSGISNDPSGKNYIGLAYNKTSPVESEVYSDYSWSLIKGDKGSQGIPGTPGDDGKTYYTWVMYADDEFGNNMQNDPEGKAYIGIAYNKETEVESNDPSQYSWALFKGKDAYVYQAYAWNADGTDRFTIDYPNENIYKGTSSDWKEVTFINYVDSVTNKTYSELGLVTGDTITWTIEIDATKSSMDLHAALGIDGVVYQGNTVPKGTVGTSKVTLTLPNSSSINIYNIRKLNSTTQITASYRKNKMEKGSKSTIWTPSPSEDFFGAFPSYSGTYTTFEDVQSVDPTKYTWQRILGQSGENGKDGIAGKDGVGVSDTDITYAQSTSGTTPPSTGWTAQVPTLVKGQYLWTKTVWTYTDASTETGYTVSYNAKDGNDGNDGIAGKDGVGIASTKVEYVGSSSGTVKPTTGWSTTIPTVAEGNFLWTRTTWTYTDSTSEVGYSVAKMGTKGDKGDKGDPGNQGIPGEPGADGRTPYVHWAYAWSMDGTDRFTTSYPGENELLNSRSPKIAAYQGSTVTLVENTVVEEWGATDAVKHTISGGTGNTVAGTLSTGKLVEANKKYVHSIYVKNIGSKVVRFNNNLSQAMDVQPGETKRLIFNPNGSATGNASKQFVLYRLNAADVQEFIIWHAKIEKSETTATIWTPAPADSFEDAYPLFAGTYSDYTSTDSEDPSDYIWQRVRGNDGADGPQGIQGPQGPNGQTYYTWLKYADTPTTGMSDSPTGKTYMGLAYNKTTATESTNYSDYSWSLIKGADGVQGPQGPDGKTTYTWIKYGTSSAGAGMSDDPTGKTYIGIAYNKTTSTESTNPADYSWSLIKGDKGDTGPQGPTGNGISGSVITYAASTSGTTAPTSGWQSTPPTVAANSFLWTRVIINYTDGTSSTSYSVGKMGAQGPQGTTGAQGPQGATGNGISSSVVNYAASTSGTTAPSTGWVTTPPTVAANQYLWTRVVISYTNGTSTTAYSVGMMGAQGPKGDTGPQGPTGQTGPQGPQGIQGVAYLQPTQPSTTQNGAQWFKTVSTTDRTVTEIYTYVTGSGWVKTPLASGSLSINTLAAISANLGNITAGTIDGVEIRGEGLYSEYDYQIVTGGTQWRKGKLSMVGGYFRNDFQTYVKSTGAVQNNGFSQFSHEDIQFVVFQGTQTTTPDRTLSITPYSFTMTDDRGRGGSLTFQDLYSLGKTGIPAASGWRQYNTSSSSANFPSATRVGRVVQLAGAFAPNAAKPSGTENEVMGTLPVGFRPDSDCNFICQGTGANMYLLVVKANGQLTFNRYRGDTGSSNNYKFDYKDCTEGAWINIACAYAAADV